MKYAFPVLLAALVATASPAMADHDRDHGRDGGWHGGGQGGGWRGGERSEPRGEGYGRGGRWGGPGGPMAMPEGHSRGEGRWGGGYAPPEAVPVDSGLPDRRQMERAEMGEARAGVRSGQIRPMGEIVSRLQRRGGRMLDANLGQGPNGQPVYRVVWASPDGRRTDYIIDARTGAILQGY